MTHYSLHGLLAIVFHCATGLTAPGRVWPGAVAEQVVHEARSPECAKGDRPRRERCRRGEATNVGRADVKRMGVDELCVKSPLVAVGAKSNRDGIGRGVKAYAASSHSATRACL